MGKRKKKSNTLPLPKKLSQALMYGLFFLLASSAYWFNEKISETQLPVEGAPVELYANQTEDDLTQTFSQAIASAKESILLLIYSLTDPTVIKQLKAKADQGVQVRVISDAKASPYMEDKLGDKIDVLRRFSKGLMHLKILVVDKRLIWLGSANMTGESLRLHGNLVEGIESPALAEEVWARASSMNQENVACGHCYRAVQAGDQKVELWFLPNNPPAVDRIISLLRSAKKTIRVAMFTFTRYDLARELIAAVKRGVRVEVVIDNASGKGASAKVVQLLASNGVPVALSTSQGLLHHKFAYIDETILVNGSANWTKSAFTVNDDCFMVVDPLTEKQQRFLNALWKVVAYESEPVH